MVLGTQRRNRNPFFSMVTVLQLMQVEFSRKLSTSYYNYCCWSRTWQHPSSLIQRKRNTIALLKGLQCLEGERANKLSRPWHSRPTLPLENIFTLTKSPGFEPLTRTQKPPTDKRPLTCAPRSERCGNPQTSMS